MLLKAKFIFLILFVFSLNIFAVEDSGESKETKESAEGEKAKEGEAPATENVKKIAEEDDWTKQANFLSSKEGKAKEFRLKIESLIKTKNSSKDEAKNKKIVNQMIEAHMEFVKATDDYNKLYNKLRYRFPDKSNTKKRRRYLPLRVQSLEQIENEMGVDADLTRLRKKVNKKYSPFLEDELKAKQEAGPMFYKGKLKQDPEDSKRIKLEK